MTPPRIVSPYQPTPVEEAISQLTHEIIPKAAADVFEQHGVMKQMTLIQFKRLLILHLHDKGLREWCREIGLPPENLDGHTQKESE